MVNRCTFSFKNVVVASILLRIVLIIYSEWHDEHSVVKYTDVDYRVFTDAARFLHEPTEGTFAKGPLGKYLKFGDPYSRDTYRYTPLLALVLTPNVWMHPSFGKYLFAACDIIVGWLLYRLLLTKVLIGENYSLLQRSQWATIYASFHLLNPMVFSISTRGSSESTINALVIGTLYFAMQESSPRRWDYSAVLLGLSAHWKLYPVIYGVSLLAVMASEQYPNVRRSPVWRVDVWSKGLLNFKTARFVSICAGTFMLLNSAMYAIWGYPFLYETYLYHLHRRDHRHNFSPYFLPIYLTYPGMNGLNGEEVPAIWQILARSPFASFVPQMALTLGMGVVFGREGARHLPFTWFTQTAAFVTFNKVCTSQYFLWYLAFLPLIIPSLSMSRSKVLVVIGSWIASQALWLKMAYDLEFLGKDVFVQVWLCSVLFFIVNCWILREIVTAYKWTSGPVAKKNET